MTSESPGRFDELLRAVQTAVAVAYNNGPHSIEATAAACEVRRQLDLIQPPQASAGLRAVQLQVKDDKLVPAVGTRVSVPVEGEWLEIGVFSDAHWSSTGMVDLTLRFNPDLRAGGSKGHD